MNQEDGEFRIYQHAMVKKQQERPKFNSAILGMHQHLCSSLTSDLLCLGKLKAAKANGNTLPANQISQNLTLRLENVASYCFDNKLL